MVATYARYGDFLAMKEIDVANPSDSEKALILDYLKRATRYIERLTGRRFMPFYESRMYSIPLEYRDLSNRLMVWDDLMLDRDLLSPQQIQVTTGSLVDTQETLSGSLDAITTTLSVTDVDGQDAVGGIRFSVGDILRIDNEYMRVLVANATANELTLTRGDYNTLAGTHADGATINKISLSTLVIGIDCLVLDFNIQPFFGLRLIWPNTWAGGYIGSIGVYRQPQIFVTGWWGYHERYPAEALVNTLEVVQIGDITSSTSTLKVSDADGIDDIGETRFSEGDLLLIEDELIEVTSVDTEPTPDEIDVFRGRHGTLAVAHDENTLIYRYAVPYDVSEQCLVIAKTLRESDMAEGGRQGVSEVSIGVELGMPTDVTKWIRMMKRPRF